MLKIESIQNLVHLNRNESRDRKSEFPTIFGISDRLSKNFWQIVDPTKSSKNNESLDSLLIQRLDSHL